MAATANVPAIDPDVDQARERSAVDLPSPVHPLIVAAVRRHEFAWSLAVDVLGPARAFGLVESSVLGVGPPELTTYFAEPAT